MQLRCLFFVIKFLFFLKFGKSTLFDVISRNHGPHSRKLVFRCIDVAKKLSKGELDIDFLKTCKTYDIFPKFLRFKLYKKALHTSDSYKTFQCQLLNGELSSKEKRISILRTEYSKLQDAIQEQLSFFEFRMFKHHKDSIVQAFIDKCKKTHVKKLHHLGIYNELKPCDPNSVIHNLSSKTIPERVKTLLAFGLDFRLPVWKPSFYHFHLSSEKLIHALSDLPLRDGVSFDDVKRSVGSICQRFYDNFDSSKLFSPIFTRSDVALLKSFSSDKSIVIAKPDKGRGVVILDRATYVKKMETIVSDTSKFSLVREPMLKTIRQVEDKINRLLGKLRSLGMITGELYKRLFVSGSVPGVLYGLPKIHKALVPLRPIFSACGTAPYNLAKFLVPVLAPLTKNEFTVTNSYEFVNDISKLNSDGVINESMYMASFDVESLFTNIPLKETIDICIRSLFSTATEVLGIPAKFFKALLELSVLNSFFIFNEKLYCQKEGVGMGLPLGPTFANIFMCHYEKLWLTSCPTSFAPIFYRRYVDDCFLLFKDRSHADLFLNYLNNQHRNIKFTMEKESNGKLPFLDVLVHKDAGRFHTSVYRKPSFSYLGTSFFSFVSRSLKFSVIASSIFRAYHISSSYTSFHKELEFLKSFFKRNGFPIQPINAYIRDFLDRQYQKPILSFEVPKLQRYFTLPYLNQDSEKLRKEIIAQLVRFYPFLHPKIILVNNFAVGTFFKYKDRLPKLCQSAVVYKFSCASCGASYVGSTIRNLHSRIQQHLGKSVRTGKFLTKPDPSPIRDHLLSCDTPVTPDNFVILEKSNSLLDLRIQI